MRTTFEVRDKAYEAEIHRAEKPEGEKFEIYEVTVRDREGAEVKGTLKLTEQALVVAEERASERGGTAGEWLAQGCARSLASEVLIRKLKPDFSFVVDHRWVAAPLPRPVQGSPP